MTLLTQIILASSVVALSVLLHLVGLAILLAILRRHRPASSQALAIVLDGAATLFVAFDLLALQPAAHADICVEPGRGRPLA